MRYVGIDLHKRFLVVAVCDEDGRHVTPRRFSCRDTEQLRTFFEAQRPFEAVVEASGSAHWLVRFLQPFGEVVLAHARQLRALVSARTKTDPHDARLLATLLRARLIPRAYVPPPRYHELRELTRARARLGQRLTNTKNELHALLTRVNVQCPYRTTFCRRGVQWLATTALGPAEDIIRDELLQRLRYFEAAASALDRRLATLAATFAEHEALLDLPGVGLFTALLIIAELGDPRRFREGRAVGAYAGLTPQVRQSGERCHHGHITRQGSPGSAGFSCRWRFISSPAIRRCGASSIGFVSARAAAWREPPSPARSP
jgi:transposase